MMDASNREAIALIEQGIAAGREGDAASATSRFAEAALLEPTASVAHFLLASELAQAGRIADAEAAYANAVLARPGFQLARYQLGLLQFSAGRPGVALMTWQPLFELADTEPLQRFVHGFAALANDRFDEALHCFRQGLDRGVDNAALAGDIRRVMQGVEALAAPAGSTAPAATVQTPPAGEASSHEPRPDVHVLLANYQGKRLIH